MATTARERPGMAAIWFGLLGGHAAWTVQLLGNTALIGLACSGDPDRATIGGFNLFTAATVGNSVAMAIVAAAALVVALLALRHARRTQPGTLGGWPGVLAATGALLDGTFVFVIVLGATSHLALPLCVSG